MFLGGGGGWLGCREDSIEMIWVGLATLACDTILGNDNSLTSSTLELYGAHPTVPGKGDVITRVHYVNSGPAEVPFLAPALCFSHSWGGGGGRGE